MFGAPENPKPGKDGTITVNASSVLPPNSSGCVRGFINSKNSTIINISQ